MDFDFYSLYEKYTNAQLLMILRHPDQYQDEAVQAVKQILDDRTITDNDRIAAGEIIHEPATEEKISAVLLSDPGLETDLLDSFNPELSQKPALSFLICFGLMSLYYLRTAYVSGKSLYQLWRYDDFSFILILINLFYLLVIPFAVFRLYTGKKGGWYIIFIENTITAVPMLYYFIISWPYFRSHFHLSIATFFYLISIIIKPFIFFFLWEKPMTDYAGVGTQHKRTTLWICIGLAIALCYLAYTVSSGKSF